MFVFVSFPSFAIVVCSPSIYGFWLPLWYLQTNLNRMYKEKRKKYKSQ